MPSRRRVLLGLAGAGVGVSLAGCAGDDDDGGDTPRATETVAATRTRTATSSETDTATEEATETLTETETDTPEPTPTPATLASVTSIDVGEWGPVVSRSGTGPTVTDPFELSSTVTTVTFHHEGDDNFIAWLVNDETDEADWLLVNDIGTIEGATAAPVGSAAYRLDVEADGEWSVELANPIVGEAHTHELPVAAGGSGRDLVGVVYLDGDTVISGEHGGEGTFTVTLYAEADTGILAGERVFNAVGSFEGAANTPYTGYCWIDVQADGEWGLHLEPA